MKPDARLLSIVLIIWGILPPISLHALYAASLAVGPELQKRLDEPVDIVWAENPLRGALEDLARNKNLSVLIDRRIDPGQKIEISLRQTPLKDALAAIAKKCGLRISLVGSVVYFAPPDAARKVRTLVALRQEEVRRLPPAITKKFLLPKPIAWEDFSTPRGLFEKLGSENGIVIAGLEQVPHDLWAAADLPPLELIQSLTLIAGQYDLTFEISADGNRVQLVPIPEQVELARIYPAGRRPETTAKSYAAIAPDARIKIDGDKIVVAGLLEDHERITAPRVPARRKTAASNDYSDFTNKRYTLKVVERPVGPLLKQLAAQLNLEIEMDDAAIERAGISLDQRVSFSVQGATVDELLRAALKQTHLRCDRQGNVLQIEPAR